MKPVTTPSISLILYVMASLLLTASCAVLECGGKTPLFQDATRRVKTKARASELFAFYRELE